MLQLKGSSLKLGLCLTYLSHKSAGFGPVEMVKLVILNMGSSQAENWLQFQAIKSILQGGLTISSVPN